MTQVAYDKSSPWANTPQVSKNQINYLDFWSGVVIDKTPSDKLIQLSKKYEHRPDLLSNDMYQTSKLWWVFAVRNPDVIRDPIWDFIAGSVIYVPDKSALKRYL